MFYDVFQGLCESCGTSPAQVRAELNIKQSTMASWKSKGLTPNTSTIARLADYFGVPVKYLLSANNVPENFSWLLDVLTDGIPKYVQNDSTGLRIALTRAQTQLALEKKNGLEGGIRQWERICDHLIKAIDECESDKMLERILSVFHQLNGTGQKRACEWISELAKIPEYQRIKAYNAYEEKRTSDYSGG